MKVQIERAVLVKALARAQSVVERRTVTPILANVLLEAEGHTLRLSATDLDLSIREKISAKVQEVGATTVPALTFYEIVKKIPDGVVNLSVEQSQMRVQAGRARFSLPCLPADDFTPIQMVPFPVSFSLPAENLKHLIESTRFSMSTDEMRYYLNGIYVHLDKREDGNFLVAAATDGHRLSRAEVPAPTELAEMPGIILPRKTVMELAGILSESSGEVRVSLSQSQIMCVFGELTLISRLVDGTYPDYARVIPQDLAHQIFLKRKDFSDAVDRVAVLAFEKTRGIRMSIQDEKVQLAAANNENGSAVEEIPVQYSGPQFEIGLNARYLLDVTQNSDADELKFSLGDSNAPIKIENPADTSILYVLMPMRV